VTGLEVHSAPELETHLPAARGVESSQMVWQEATAVLQTDDHGA
jgi:hypothetical protein